MRRQNRVGREEVRTVNGFIEHLEGRCLLSAPPAAARALELGVASVVETHRAKASTVDSVRSLSDCTDAPDAVPLGSAGRGIEASTQMVKPDGHGSRSEPAMDSSSAGDAAGATAASHETRYAVVIITARTWHGNAVPHLFAELRLNGQTQPPPRVQVRGHESPAMSDGLPANDSTDSNSSATAPTSDTVSGATFSGATQQPQRPAAMDPDGVGVTRGARQSRPFAGGDVTAATSPFLAEFAVLPAQAFHVAATNVWSVDRSNNALFAPEGIARVVSLAVPGIAASRDGAERSIAGGGPSTWSIVSTPLMGPTGQAISDLPGLFGSIVESISSMSVAGAAMLPMMGTLAPVEPAAAPPLYQVARIDLIGTFANAISSFAEDFVASTIDGGLLGNTAMHAPDNVRAKTITTIVLGADLLIAGWVYWRARRRRVEALGSHHVDLPLAAGM